MKRFLIFITILLTAYTSYAEKFNQDVTRLETPFYIFPRTGSQHIDMSPDWQLYSLDERIESVSELQGKEFIDVASPTSIQMAYYKAGKLPHPYEHMNSELYKYLGQQAHYYRKTFRTPATLEGDNVYFCFDGIDYDAKVWVNGECIGAHSGMFGGPSIKIQPFLKGEGMENELIVEVLSANYKNPNISTRGAIDKIHSWFFSNDFASPTFYHLGMWNGSRLEILPKYHIERPYLVTEKISDGKATLQFSAELFSGTSSNDYSLGEGNIVHSTNPLNLIQDKPVKDDITVRLIFRDGENIAYEKVFKPYVIEGRCWMEESFDLDHPKLWYPNGMGDQSVYHVSAVLDVNGKKTDRIDFDFGIRTIEQVRSAGVRTEPRWKDWQFIVNGEKLFLKGMNWMPLEALSDIKYENYDWALRAARDMGIQILRVWGTGYLETKDFYDCCNKYGIMVWQGFSAANNITENWPRLSWEALVCQNIYRLRNQPSLAVWSGGNEYPCYHYGNAAVVGITERSLAEFDPSRFFVRNTPDGGALHSYPDFDPNWYKGFKLIPYVSETGIHSMCNARGNRKLIKESEFCEMDKLVDEGFRDRHPEFVHHFIEYLPDRAPRMLSRATHIDNVVGISYENMVEATQIGAGEFYQVMSESIQSNYPVTTGLMVWTYKRPNPVVAGINLMDYYGQPSAPYYFMKRTYEPVHILLDIPWLLYAPGDKFTIKANILNGFMQDAFDGTISVRIMNDRFETIAEYSKEASAAEGCSVAKYEIGEFQIPDDYKERYFFLCVTLSDKDGKVISRSNYWPRTIRQMEDKEFHDKYISSPTDWPSIHSGPWLKPTVAQSKTKLTVSGLKSEGNGTLSFTVTNTGKKPSPFTYIQVDDEIFYCSDDYFWLDPGESKAVTVNIKNFSPDRKFTVSVNSWNAKSCIPSEK